MKIYDLIENIKVWVELYKESSEEDKTTENWKKGMLKVLSKLSVSEELNATPFKQKLEEIIEKAKKEELDQLPSIYNDLNSITNYFQENYDALN